MIRLILLLFGTGAVLCKPQSQGQVPASTVAAAQPAAAPAAAPPPPAAPAYPPRRHAKILHDRRSHTVNGDFSTSVAQEDGTNFYEVTDVNGVRRGGYTFINDQGKQETVEYEAGPFGFRILNANNLPVAPDPYAALRAQQASTQASPTRRPRPYFVPQRTAASPTRPPPTTRPPPPPTTQPPPPPTPAVQPAVPPTPPKPFSYSFVTGTDAEHLAHPVGGYKKAAAQPPQQRAGILPASTQVKSLLPAVGQKPVPKVKPFSYTIHTVTGVQQHQSPPALPSPQPVPAIGIKPTAAPPTPTPPRPYVHNPGSLQLSRNHHGFSYSFNAV